jgi:hypothetical protein
MHRLEVSCVVRHICIYMSLGAKGLIPYRRNWLNRNSTDSRAVLACAVDIAYATVAYLQLLSTYYALCGYL